MDIKLKSYQKTSIDKLDSVGAGVNIERHHKEFLKKHSINLSALVRDVLDKLINESKEDKENEKDKK